MVMRKLLKLFCFCSISLTAQVNDVDLYVFGHSLIDWGTPTIPVPNRETAVPYWMNHIANHTGKNYAATGQFGFLPNHTIPPSPNWGYPSVISPWDDSTQTFASSSIDHILITAGNFIQYELPTGPHPLNNTTTAVDETNRIFDWVNQQKPNSRYYIYANWPEMDTQLPFPPNIPSANEISSFYSDSGTGNFAAWWETYQNDMLAARPNYNTRLIPVGKLISEIVNNVITTPIAFDNLYEDSSPHGRASTYFLAGLITYMAMYEEQPDLSNYDPGTTVIPEIRNNLTAINTYIWTELMAYNFSNGDSRVFYNTPLSNYDVLRNSISIYPNPAKDFITINGISSNHQIRLYSINGKKINCLINESQLNLTALENGIYFLKIEDNTRETITTFKIILNK